jgi:hypothetical protein
MTTITGKPFTVLGNLKVSNNLIIGETDQSSYGKLETLSGLTNINIPGSNIFTLIEPTTSTMSTDSTSDWVQEGNGGLKFLGDNFNGDLNTTVYVEKQAAGVEDFNMKVFQGASEIGSFGSQGEISAAPTPYLINMRIIAVKNDVFTVQCANLSNSNDFRARQYVLEAKA